MPAARRLGLVLGTAVVAALGVAALVQANRHPDQALAGGAAGALALQLAAGLGAYGAGADLALRGRPRLSGVLLAASGIALLLGGVPLPEAGGPALFTAALVAGSCAPALAGAAAVCHPFVGRRLGALVAGTAATTVLALGVLPAATFDPTASGCFSCPRNLLFVRDEPGLHDAVVSSAPWLQALLCAMFAVVAATRWAVHPALVRATAAPVGFGGAVVAALGAAVFGHDAAAKASGIDGATRALWLTQCAALLLVAMGVGARALRARALRGHIAEIVIGTLPSPERLRDALASRLGDPLLAIAYPGGRADPVDADGRVAPDPAPGTTTTEVIRRRRVVALLYHDPALTHAPERLAAAARAAGPALEHASLRARLRAELADLRASRTRIVELADAERRRLERDLHDGAQQRLIALSVALQDAGDPALARAHEEVRAALEDLRTLAHGIHPVALSDAGLDAAIDRLAEDSRIPVRLDSRLAMRFPPAIEAAAYRFVLEAVRCAESYGTRSVVAVRISHAAGALLVRIAIPAVDTVTASRWLEHAEDRIVALDGELTIWREEGAARVEARIPCGS